MPIVTTLVERFWSKVDIRGTDQCWPWLAYARNGYGRISLANKLIDAHRLSYELANGPIPRGKHVLHSCDNPGGVNPRHLSLGTHRQNIADRGSRGRTCCGIDSPHAKLNDAQVIEIRQLLKAGEHTQAEIGARYGVSKGSIWAIHQGITWAHVSESQ